MTKLPARLNPSSVIVITDSREQNPLDLSPLKTVPGTLPTGDYILGNLSHVDAISIRGIVLYCESHLRDAIPPPSPSSHVNYELNENIWREHLASLRVELVGIEAEIPGLQIEHDESIAAVETILDYYVSERNDNHGDFLASDDGNYGDAKYAHRQ